MTVKWDSKKAMECLKERKNPFAETQQNKGLLAGIGDKVKEILLRNKGATEG